ncbi:MAG TPA: DUF3160 domain-containing protein [Chloroflexia bacterium]|nr:DUF3160 domain-containing protein [Chloroflexia bacterium]
MAGLILALNLLLAACGDSTTPSPAITAVQGELVPGITAGPGVTNPSSPTGMPVTSTVAPTTTTSVPSTSVPPTTEAAPTATPLPALQRYNPAFAAYKEAPLSNATPAFKSYTVAPDLSNIANLKNFELTAEQKKLLAQNYFVVEPAQFKQIYSAYERIDYSTIPLFVTTDSVAHVYHLLFDKALRDTERQFLIKDMRSLNLALFEATTAQYAKLKGSPLEKAAIKAVAYVSVARKLANPKDNFAVPAYASSLVEAELKLINETAGINYSPIMGNGYQEDYSQYKPRGHYTLSEDLQNYFKGMMWYGRITFRLNQEEDTLAALLLTQASQTGQADNRKAALLWQLIYEPTAFFVGNSDDITYLDYANLAKATYGDAATTDPTVFNDTAKLAVFRKAAEQLAAPRISNLVTGSTEAKPEEREQSNKGLRLMGQRFTFDSYIHQNLISPYVGTPDQARTLPKGLDIFAAFGSSQAFKLLGQQSETKYANYSAQMDKMKAQVSNINTDTWTSNLYWGWLYSLKTLAQPKSEGYPKFMQNEGWTNKQLNTGLASWTELRHDTILYAKQVFGLGGGGGPEELPYGFVEPEPLYYARLAALAQMTRQGLEVRGLIDTKLSDSLKKFEDAALLLKTISEKELSNQPLNDQEKEAIAYWGGRLRNLTDMAADSDEKGGAILLDQQDAALAADVASSADGVLEEATGRFNYIYVAVLINGKVSLTQGVVYSQYEFKVPLSGRLTDQAWQQQLDAGKAPNQEAWKRSIMAPGVPKQNQP